MKYQSQYEAWLTATRQKSNYKYLIRPFLKFCEENNIKYELITFNDLNKYMICLQEKNIEAGTINNYNKAVRNFYKFLVRSKIVEGEIYNNRIVNSQVYQTVMSMRFLPSTEKEKMYFTEVEIKDMIEMHISLNKCNPYQVKAIVWTMFFTGVRLGEFLNFRREDFDFEKQEAIIYSRKDFQPKTYVERKVPLIKEVLIYIQDYFDSDPLKSNAFNINRNSIKTMFKHLNEFAPSGKVFTPKTLRTSFAFMTLRTEDGKGNPMFNPSEVQKLMGHKSVETLLKHYYNPTAEEARSRYKEKMNKLRKNK